jgi:hypothetical protein
MSSVILFISETKLKQFTALDWNVRPEQLVPYIITAQDISGLLADCGPEQVFLI